MKSLLLKAALLAACGYAIFRTWRDEHRYS